MSSASKNKNWLKTESKILIFKIYENKIIYKYNENTV
jgi:hypothetical protein